MNKNDLVCTNFTKSGICDRLLDLSLIITFSSVLKIKYIYLHWFYDKNVCSGLNGVYRPEFRKIDILEENIKKYITLPENVIFLNMEHIHILSKNKSNYIFNTYLGGIYNPKNFYEQFVKNYTTYDIFLKEYLDIVSKMKIKNIDINIDIKSCVAVHLRRTDKVIPKKILSDIGQIASEDLDELDTLTDQMIEFLYTKGYSKFIFCSDDIECKVKYEKKYIELGYNIIQINAEDKNLQTYYDMFYLINSTIIIQSCKYSNFSNMCSMIGNVKMIYFYPESQKLNNLKDIFKNFIYYKDLRGLINQI